MDEEELIERANLEGLTVGELQARLKAEKKARKAERKKRKREEAEAEHPQEEEAMARGAGVPSTSNRDHPVRSVFAPANITHVGVTYHKGTANYQVQRRLGTTMFFGKPRCAFKVETQAYIAHDLWLLRGGPAKPPLTRQEARDMGLNYDLGVSKRTRLIFTFQIPKRISTPYITWYPSLAYTAATL